MVDTAKRQEWQKAATRAKEYGEQFPPVWPLSEQLTLAGSVITELLSALDERERQLAAAQDVIQNTLIAQETHQDDARRSHEECARLKDQLSTTRGTLILLEQAYRHPHSPQHRAAVLNEATSVIGYPTTEGM